MKPQRTPAKRWSFRLAVGLGMIVLGMLYAFRNLGWFGLEGVLHFWPSALGLMAIIGLIVRGPLAVGSHVLLLIACAMQLHAMGYASWVHRGWPVAIIWLGCLQVARALLPRAKGVRMPKCCGESCQDPR